MAIEPTAVQRGDRLYRYVYAGLGGQHDIQELIVVRVNQKTYTVDTKHHDRVRVPHEQIVGRVDW